MSVEASRKRLLRFGAFEVDLAAGEVRKHGLRVRLQDQPFQVLAALLDRPGEVVTRDELVRRLWADGTVVDYDAGLNAAVTRLRQSLSDSAETPRYVETVARRGYRWIAPVQHPDDPKPAMPTPPAPSPKRSPRLIAAIVAAAVIAVAAITRFTLHRGAPAELSIRISPVTTGLGMERNASFSPDGTQVVYEWDREDKGRHIYIKEVGAGDPVPLTSGESAEYGPEWSPDGRLIAFLRATGPAELDLYVVPPVGGAERKVASLASVEPILLGRFARRMAWTADSNHVIVSVPDRHGHGEGLLLVSIADGTTRWLTDPKPDAINGDREPVVSSDGHHVAFARGEIGAAEMIWLLPLTADLRAAEDPQPLSAAGRSRSPAWSPDGTAILFTGVNPVLADSGVSKIFITGGAPVTILPAGTSAGNPAVSRTGRVAFTRTRVESGIYRQEIPAPHHRGRAPEQLTKASSADANAEYSPDGRRIVFVSNRSGTGDIWTCDADSAHCRVLTSFGANYATGSPRWSPDGRQIAFDSAKAGRTHIYVVDATGGTPRRLTDNQTGGAVPAWSRDGAWIYFTSARSGSNEIWKIPSAGGAPVRVTRSGGFLAAETPSADALFYTKTSGEAELFRSELDGSHERLVLRGIANRGFVVTDDRVYYLHREADGSISIRASMLRTTDDMQIARLPNPLFPGLTLSPDGRYLVYTQTRIQSNLILADGVFP